MHAQESSGVLAPSGAQSRNVRVLHALNPPDGRTRYVDHMLGSNPPGVDQTPFSWRRALLEPYDILHVHWPENLVKARTGPRTYLKSILAVLLIVRLYMFRTPVVRTLHNLTPHEDQLLPGRIISRSLDRLTAHYICLNPATQAPSGSPSSVILHGHYRGVYRRTNVPADPSKLLYFGIIRPYKGVENLIDGFRALPGHNLRLRIVGQPLTSMLRESIIEKSRADPRIELRLEFVSDDDLAREIEESAMVVLPYREMHNSGAALLALSLDRPVLAPATVANIALRDEVGPHWLHLYQSAELGTEELRDAYEAVNSKMNDPSDRPDLSGRDWQQVGNAHAGVYVRLARTRGSFK